MMKQFCLSIAFLFMAGMSCMAEDWLLTTVPTQDAYKRWKVYDAQAENNTRLWILGEKREIDGTTWWELL